MMRFVNLKLLKVESLNRILQYLEIFTSAYYIKRVQETKGGTCFLFHEKERKIIDSKREFQ